MLEIPDFLGGRRVDAGPEATYAEKMRVPRPPGARQLKNARERAMEGTLYAVYMPNFLK